MPNSTLQSIAISCKLQDLCKVPDSTSQTIAIFCKLQDLCKVPDSTSQTIAISCKLQDLCKVPNSTLQLIAISCKLQGTCAKCPTVHYSQSRYPANFRVLVQSARQYITVNRVILQTSGYLCKVLDSTSQSIAISCKFQDLSKVPDSTL